MTTVRIYIVRHGETDENRQGIMQGQLDTKLNAAGVEQARLTAVALEKVPFERAFSSDLQRAIKTAEIILKTHSHVALERHEALRERYLGDWQGTTIDGQGSTAPANAEPLVAFTARATQWWAETIVPYAASQTRRSEGKGPAHVLIVSHGGYISKMIYNLLDSGRVQAQAGMVTGRCWNASVSVIEVGEDGQGTLVVYSDTTHLKGDLVATNVDVVESPA
ncbi:phosphoglycerate mutase-like protein [Amylocystis lapponica]|nr:phosphoglycerate mutase-like protein [Amylocystis lapponica]